MPDFYQHKLICTLHHLTETDLGAREAEMEIFSKERPVALIMPALFSEVGQQAFPRILEELAQVRYISDVIVSMNRMDAGQFEFARKFIGDRLPSSQNWRILWNDGPRVRRLYDELGQSGLTSYVPGKGYNVWMAFGYILARGTSRVVAAHDSDILSYNREMLLRLCLPTVHPLLGYEYAKSYYGRVSDRLYGRVTRLFVAPLLRSMAKVIGSHPLLDYLDSFRYPLSGEFSCTVEVARSMRMPGDWGLEIGMLCEVYKNTTADRICQVDLGNNFEHKHQHLGMEAAVPSSAQHPPDAPHRGLMKMARDISLTLFSNLCAGGEVLSPAVLKAIRMTYGSVARDYVRRYHDDAIINGLNPYRHEESAAVDAYEIALNSAVNEFNSRDYESPQIPSWNRVFSVLPHFADRLIEAVDADNA